jgi:hypothetical protein
MYIIIVVYKKIYINNIMVNIHHAHSQDGGSTDKLNKSLDGKHAMVLYYMTGCGHCEMMKPEWLLFEEEVKTLPFEIVIARVNQDVMGMVNADQDIMGFPTIFHLHNRKKQREFNGERSKVEFRKFLEDIIAEEKKNTIELQRQTEDLERTLDEIANVSSSTRSPMRSTKSKTKNIKKKTKSRSTKSKTKTSKKKHKPTPYPKSQSQRKSPNKPKHSRKHSSKSRSKKSRRHTKTQQKGYPFTETFSLD